jgi:hypothetical protein
VEHLYETPFMRLHAIREKVYGSFEHSILLQ